MHLQVKLPPPALQHAPIRILRDGATAESSPIQLDACRRVLVVKLDHIGDWILCTPFLENLRRNAPQAEIDALVLPRVYDLASACPHVDRIVALEKIDDETFEVSAQGWNDAAGFARDYSGSGFDLVIVPRWDADFEGAARIAAGSQARFVVGFSERCTRRKRVINRGDDRFYTHVIEDQTTAHEVEHNLNLLEAMNGRVTSRHAAVQVSEADEQATRLWLARQFGPYPGPFIALAPFASEPKREFPIHEFAALAQRISALFRCRFIIIGGTADRLRCARLAALLRPEAASTAGQLSIRETAALIGRCDALVGVDSGPVHLAAAVGTPVAVLSCHPVAGSPKHANSPMRFAPWAADGSSVLVLQPASGTPPCSDCCNAAGPHCILGIEEDAHVRLTAFIKQALEGASALPRAHAAQE